MRQVFEGTRNIHYEHLLLSTDFYKKNDYYLKSENTIVYVYGHVTMKVGFT